MIDPIKLDDIAKQLTDSLPESLKELQADLRQQFKLILQDLFAQLELVTREEFDAQRKVLERTREKLTTLEKQLATLEAMSKYEDKPKKQ